jgi:hypothetical protein
MVLRYWINILILKFGFKFLVRILGVWIRFWFKELD